MALCRKGFFIAVTTYGTGVDSKAALVAGGSSNLGLILMTQGCIHLCTTYGTGLCILAISCCTGSMALCRQVDVDVGALVHFSQVILCFLVGAGIPLAAAVAASDSDVAFLFTEGEYLQFAVTVALCGCQLSAALGTGLGGGAGCFFARIMTQLLYQNLTTYSTGLIVLAISFCAGGVAGGLYRNSNLLQNLITGVAVGNQIVGAGIGAVRLYFVLLSRSLTSAGADSVVALCINCSMLGGVSQEVYLGVLTCIICRIKAIELTAVNLDGTLQGIVAVQSPCGSLALELTAVNHDFATVLNIDQVEVQGVSVSSCANIGVGTAIDGYLAAVSPNSHIVVIAADTVDGAFAIDSQVAASLYPEHAVAGLIVLGGSHGEAVQIQNDSFVNYNCCVSVNVCQQIYSAAYIDSVLQGNVFLAVNFCYKLSSGVLSRTDGAVAILIVMTQLLNQNLTTYSTGLIVLAISLCAGLVTQLLGQDLLTYGTNLIVFTISRCAFGVSLSSVNFFATVGAVHSHITEFLSRSICVIACGFGSRFT